MLVEQHLVCSSSDNTLQVPEELESWRTDYLAFS